MKHFRLAFVSGFALDIPALLILFMFAFHPVTTQETISIAPGAESYGSLEVDLNGGAPISGTYESISGNDILFMLLDEGQFAEYAANVSHSSRFSAVSASGSFSIEQVDMERCYLVVEQATEFSSAEEVRVTFELNEMDLVYLALSLSLFTAGGIIIMYALYTRNKERVDARISASKYVDVVFFEEKR